MERSEGVLRFSSSALRTLGSSCGPVDFQVYLLAGYHRSQSEQLAKGVCLHHGWEQRKREVVCLQLFEMGKHSLCTVRIPALGSVKSRKH
jgi:hypothetical protein